jgi:hypothetical protein
MTDMRRMKKRALDRVNQTESMRIEALKKVAEAEANYRAVNDFSMSLIQKRITTIQTEIDAALQQKEKSPQAAPRGKVEGVNVPALGLRPPPGI